MKTRVSSLKEVLELLKPVVPKKPTLEVTKSILLDNGKAAATDLETRVEVNYPDAEGIFALLPFTVINDLVKYIPGDELLDIDLTSKGLTKISWDDGAASYPVKEAVEFPPTPKEREIKGDGLLDGDLLIGTMATLKDYAAQDENRPALSGVVLILGNPVAVAAADGFRLSHQALPMSFPLEEKVIVPRHAIAVLEHLLAKTPRTPPDTGSLLSVVTAKRQLPVSLSEGLLRVDFGKTATAYIQPIEGKFPDYIHLIPKEEPVMTASVFAPELEAAVRRVSRIAKDGSGIVRLVYDDTSVTVSANSTDGPSIEARVPLTSHQGEMGRAGINVGYLLNYLAGKDSLVVIKQYQKDASGPIVFRYKNSPETFIMPMLVQWDEKEPEEAKEPASPENAANNVSADNNTNNVSPEAKEPVAVSEAAAAGETGAPKRRDRKRKV